MASFIAGFIASVVGDALGFSERGCLLLAIAAGVLVAML